MQPRWEGEHDPQGWMRTRLSWVSETLARGMQHRRHGRATKHIHQPDQFHTHSPQWAKRVLRIWSRHKPSHPSSLPTLRPHLNANMKRVSKPGTGTGKHKAALCPATLNHRHGLGRFHADIRQLGRRAVHVDALDQLDAIVETQLDVQSPAHGARVAQIQRTGEHRAV